MRSRRDRGVKETHIPVILLKPLNELLMEIIDLLSLPNLVKLLTQAV